MKFWFNFVPYGFDRFERCAKSALFVDYFGIPKDSERTYSFKFSVSLV